MKVVLLLAYAALAGARIAVQSMTELTSVTITGRSEYGNGGAVNAWSNTNKFALILRNCEFQDVAISTSSSDSQADGGGLCSWNVDVEMHSCKLLKCRAEGNGGAVCVKKGSFIANVCHFSECAAGGFGTAVGVLDSDGTSETKLLMSSCTIEDCNEEGQSVLFLRNLTEATFSGNVIQNCRCLAYPVLTISTVVLAAFNGNHFDLGQNVTSILLDTENETLVVKDCNFSNNQEKFSAQSQFVVVSAPRDKKISFVECVFQDMVGVGPPAFEMTASELEAVACQFANLHCDWNGGAINSQDTPILYLQGCQFSRCSCGDSDQGGGGGGVYINYGCKYAEVYGCEFINNVSPVNGQSIQIPFDESIAQLHIQNCTFRGHESDSIIGFQYKSGETYQDPYEINNCSFVGNHLTRGNFGVVKADSSAGIVYQNCSFVNNDHTNGAAGLVSMNNNGTVSSYCRFIECNFDECASDTGILFCPSGYLLQELLIDRSSFVSCSGVHIGLSSSVTGISVRDSVFTSCIDLGSGLLSISSVEGSLVDTVSFSSCTFDKYHLREGVDAGDSHLLHVTACQTVSICDNTFTECSSGNIGSIAHITCNNLSFVNNLLDLRLTTAQSAIYLSISNWANSVVLEDNTFLNGGNRLDGGSAHFVQMPASPEADVSFVNCTFSDIEAAGCASFEVSVGSVHALGCRMIRLACDWNGGGFHSGETTNVFISDCTIDSCRCGDSDQGGGGGGVYLNYGCKYAEVYGCEFINNVSPVNGQSIQVPFDESIAQLVMRAIRSSDSSTSQVRHIKIHMKSITAPLLITT